MSTLSDLPTATPRATQHGLLVAFGHFARQIGLLPQLQQVPVPQKTVTHTPAAKLTTLFLGLLTGIEYLSDLTHAPAPLYHDPEVARAWDLPALPEASGVSRTLTACTPQSLAGLQQALECVMHPFLQRALTDLRTRQQELVLDADLTGQPLSATSTTYPDAAFGYMDGSIHLGYQIAEISLHTPLYGRQWLAGQQHPGDTVSAPCLLALVQDAECRLGCHPRRRVELLDARMAAAQQTLIDLKYRAAAADHAAQVCEEREAQWHEQIATAQQRLRTLARPSGSPQLGKPQEVQTQLHAQIGRWERQLRRSRQHWAEAVWRGDQLRARISSMQATRTTLHTRRVALAAENAAQPDAPRCRLRLDGGFSSGANLTLLLELGYDIDTKAHGPGVSRALQARVTTETGWQRVGKNAEMIASPTYYMHTCPYPLTVGLERFHTPRGWQYSVLLRYHSAERGQVPDLATWFQEYNARASVEAGIKQEKTVFHVQHLWSHSRIGMQIQIALTLFAANCVSWAREWVAARLHAAQQRVSERFLRVKHLVRIAANSPAIMEEQAMGVLVRFSPLSSLAGVIIRLATHWAGQSPSAPTGESP